jgi:hypothetical protein
MGKKVRQGDRKQPNGATERKKNIPVAIFRVKNKRIFLHYKG